MEMDEPINGYMYVSINIENKKIQRINIDRVEILLVRGLSGKASQKRRHLCRE